MSWRCLGSLTNLILDSERQRGRVHVVHVAPHGYVTHDFFRNRRRIAIQQANWVDSPPFAEGALRHMYFGGALLVLNLDSLLHKWPTPVTFDTDGGHQVLVPSVEEDQRFPCKVVRQLSYGFCFRGWMPRLVPVELTEQPSLPGAM